MIRTPLTTEDVGRLLTLLRANALEMAAELREAGWEEDERGLWSNGRRHKQHLYDAHALETRRET